MTKQTAAHKQYRQALTDGDYISADLVKQTLKQETPKTTEALRPGYEIVNTNQSPEDINYDIIRMVLEQ